MARASLNTDQRAVPPPLKRVVRSGVVSAVDLFIRTVGQFAIMAILARLLDPRDFGVWALAAMFSIFANTAIQAGIGTAIIRQPHDDPGTETGLMVLACLSGIAAALLLAAFAPLLAVFFAQETLTGLVILAALSVALTSPAVVPMAILTRRMQFGRLALSSTVSVGTSGVCAIALAARGMGSEAFAWSAITAAAVQSTMVLAIGGWRPARPEPAAVAASLHFGKWMSASSMLEIAYSQGSAAVIGKFYSTADVGLFTRALALQQMGNAVIAGIFGRMAMPLFAANRDDRDRLHRGMELALRIIMLVNVPIMVGLSLVSDLAIEVIYGPKWLAAAPILSILALSGILFPLSLVNLQLLAAQGHSREFFRIEVLKKGIAITLMLSVAWLGTLAIAWSFLAASVIAIFFNSRKTADLADYPLGAQLRSISDLVFPLVAMTGGVLALRGILDLKPVIELFVLTVSGAGVYFVIGNVSKCASFAGFNGALMSAMHK